MRLWRRKIPFALLLVAAMLALLPVLAVLQYRWLGQVSEAERERMQRNLTQAISHFRQDFDHEIARAYLHFQPEKPLERGQIGAQYSALLGEWRSKSANPRLIRDLFWVDAAKRPQLDLKRFDASTGSLVATDWPPELTAWRDQIVKKEDGSDRHLGALQLFLGDVTRRIASPSRSVERTGELEVGGRGVTEDRPSGRDLGPFMRILKTDEGLARPSRRVLENVPALVIALPTPDPNPGMRTPATPSPEGGYILARLDLNFIKDDLIPALVARYFQTDSGLDYLVMVASREDKDRVIYRSSPAANTQMSTSSDGSIGIFAVRPEEYGNVLAERFRARAGSAADVLERSDRVTMRVVNRSTASQLPPKMNLVVMEMDGYWQIFLKHRAGSLEAAVGNIRRRSFAISLGVLGFLGASIILLLISTRRAQRLAEQQMDFVAGVSHELRTPLAVIRSAAENLADGYIGSPEHIQRYGALIRDEGRRLTDMVEQVLEVAGVQSGRRSYQFRPVDAKLVIEQALVASALMITESGVEIDVQTEEQVPLIDADASALGRAIQNLISNAIKYSGENRRVNIRSSLDKRDSRQEVRIEIEDFGIGIPAEDLPHIFEPFYRGRGVIAAQIHGSGLGLSLVKHIVESHGGRISVESNPGRGTLFTLSLPAIGANRSEVGIVEGYEQTYPAH